MRERDRVEDEALGEGAALEADEEEVVEGEDENAAKRQKVDGDDGATATAEKGGDVAASTRSSGRKTRSGNAM